MLNNLIRIFIGIFILTVVLGLIYLSYYLYCVQWDMPFWVWLFSLGGK